MLFFVSLARIEKKANADSAEASFFFRRRFFFLRNAPITYITYQVDIWRRSLCEKSSRLRAYFSKVRRILSVQSAINIANQIYCEECVIYYPFVILLFGARKTGQRLD